MNYWIFQANPKRWKVFNALDEKKIDAWLVNQYRDKIKKGDKAILYVVNAEKKRGIYATFDIVSNVETAEIAIKSKYIIPGAFDENPRPMVKIKITNNWIKEPLLKSDIDCNYKLVNIKGRMGTNFPMTEEEYSEILRMRGL